MRFLRHGSGVQWWKNTAPEDVTVQEPDAPLAHRRPGYSLSGCTPAEPDSASPGAGSIAELQEPVQGQRFNLVSKHWYPRHGSPGHGRVVATWVRTPLQKFNRIWASP